MVSAGYVWRNGFPTKADATAFAQQLQTLKLDDGTVDIVDVLEANRPEGAPLHDDIEWDDAAAAQQYRLSYVRQAMGALRVIPVDLVREEPLQPVRAVLPTRVSNGDAGTANTYSFVVTMQGQEEVEFTAKVRQEALTQVKRMAQRFATMPGCEDIAEQLNSIVELL